MRTAEDVRTNPLPGDQIDFGAGPCTVKYRTLNGRYMAYANATGRHVEISMTTWGKKSRRATVLHIAEAPDAK